MIPGLWILNEIPSRSFMTNYYESFKYTLNFDFVIHCRSSKFEEPLLQRSNELSFLTGFWFASPLANSNGNSAFRKRSFKLFAY